MRIPSGVTDQYIYFVAVDSTDFTTRETGLSSFTVYRSRNGAAAAAMTTPTINETDSSNMPGVYELLLDEDMTIASGNQSEEMVFHITQASMAPVTRVIELYRSPVTPGETLTVTSGLASANTTQIEGADATDQINAACDTALADYDGPTDTEMLAAFSALNNISTAEVNAEVVDALATDTYAEPGQGTPAATLSLAAKINYLFKAWRNKTTQTAAQYTLYADDESTTDQIASVTDDGTTFTRGEISTGA